MHTPFGIIIYFFILAIIIAILYVLVLAAERDKESGDDYPVPSKHTDDND